MTRHIDFLVAWDWGHDREFLSVLADACARADVRFHAVTGADASHMIREIRTGAAIIGTFLDRAAPDEEPYASLAAAVRSSGSQILNHPDRMQSAIDKATMHLEFLAHGLDVPYTIIISPYNHATDVELSLTELAHLGRPFIIKPANTTGGGTGVILGAETLKDVLESRKHHRNDKYLLQEKIVPATMGGRRTWFRVFNVRGTIIPCWWDDLTHFYGQVAAPEMPARDVNRLLALAKSIGDVCRLDFFSTEIALTEAGRLVAVDYVNEICDMRLQSMHPDGVPDAVVQQIAEILASSARTISR